MYGLVFDLDGVITDTAKFHYIAWKMLADAIGIEIDEVFNEQLKGVSRRDSLMRILAYGNKTKDFTEAEITEMLTRKNDEYVKLLEQLTPNDILPGVRKLLEQAKVMGYKTVIASASLNAPYILKKLGIMENFDAIVNPSELTNSKPDPEIFIKALALIGVNPSHAIGFEDAQAGVDGLKAAKIFTVGIITHGDLQDTDINVATLEAFDLDSIHHQIMET